ncbi:MAG: thermonuclease family protein [Deltaproteobacteria bacterium]|jgi:endonuclease YncB( thermonuclease family)|nr:thermonuclease family protein [Deltaproteobacteria bacterium]
MFANRYLKVVYFLTILFVVTPAIIFLPPLITNAFSDGNVHVEGQFTFPLSSKKTKEKNKVWHGIVVGVSDGDTITVLHEGKGEKIRLYGIDAPEKGQAFSKKAKQFTSSMVYGKTVKVETKDTDQYGCTVAIVYVDGQSLNEALVKNGFAWVYRKYCKEEFCEDWLNLEIVARYGKIGLWSEPNPIPPWDFRYARPNS